MTQYILLVQGNIKGTATQKEWDVFFEAVKESGLFRGGSEIGSRTLVGEIGSAQPTSHIVAYMRFDSDDKQQILNLLKKHPVIIHGGSAELCEMPESSTRQG